MEVKKYFTLGEEIFNAILHGVGAGLAITGLILGIIKADSAIGDVSISLFMGAAIILYLMSTMYHSFPKGTTKNVFERFDHTAIYLLISGTYTPFCLITLKDENGLLFAIILWSLALLGVVLKAIWIERFVVLHVLIFLGMGWAVVFKFGELTSNLGTTGIVLLIVGGVSYSIGTIFYVFSLFKFHHAIWHMFVLAGTILHYFAVYLYVI